MISTKFSTKRIRPLQPAMFAVVLAVWSTHKGPAQANFLRKSYINQHVMSVVGGKKMLLQRFYGYTVF